jgi:hypothetical protein
MASKENQASTARRLHRSFGAGAAVFVIFMVLSGLVINHSNGLGLDQRHVSQNFLLNWYGLDEPEYIHSFEVDSDWISFAGSQLYLNGNSVSTLANGVGAVAGGDMLIAAGGEELLLLGRDGLLIERISWGPPGSGPIESIGLLEYGGVVIKSANQLWLADADLLNWQRAENTATTPVWSHSDPAPEVFREAITRQYRGGGLSLEQLLLDLHSGRIFGSIGVLVYDLLALAIGFLAISGLLLWFRGRRNGNGKRNGKRQ